ncbi:MAG: LeuA family protein [Planctomycetota bacterium]
MDREQLIFDWNVQGQVPPRPRVIEFDDETLRDGLQSPSVTDPSIDEKIALLHLMAKVGIRYADIGLPGAGGQVNQHVMLLAKEIVRSHIPIQANCAARTLVQDIAPVKHITAETGLPIEVCIFIGSSPIRQYAEDWTLERMLSVSEEALAYCAQHRLPVMYVTEDTTRAHPEAITRLYKLAIEMGAQRVCVCDTCGHATPNGVRNLVAFVKQLVTRLGKPVKIDWHGHMDRGLGVINSIAALEAGADRVHATALGIGERAGNTPMDQLLVNLKLLDWIDTDLHALGDYCRLAASACGVGIPHNYPVFGPDAFETATGVHAAAVIKAFKKGDPWLANRVYSGVPADEFGLKQSIRIGAMSGKSNVLFWLEEHGEAADEDLVALLLDRAKHSRRLLTDAELKGLVAEHRRQ